DRTVTGVQTCALPISISRAATYVSGRIGRTAADRAQDFLTGFRPIAENAEHPARHHGGVRLAYSAGGHAAMRSFDDDGDPVRLRSEERRVGKGGSARW